ncbi:MAG: NusG domain II-containing protein [Lachnospiraceae bacterium]
MKHLKNNHKRDIILVSVVLFISLILYLITLWYSTNNSADTVIITVDGSVYGTYPLYNEDPQYIDIAGTNTLEIIDGIARMIDADCPDSLCIHQGSIHRNLESIICLPNKVVVEISTATENEFDAVTK